MNKRDIQDRIQTIDARLNELPTICEREQRQLNESETKEMNELIAERARLVKQLDEIDKGNFTPVKDQKPKFSLLSAYL